MSIVKGDIGFIGSWPVVITNVKGEKISYTWINCEGRPKATPRKNFLAIHVEDQIGLRKPNEKYDQKFPKAFEMAKKMIEEKKKTWGSEASRRENKLLIRSPAAKLSIYESDDEDQDDDPGNNSGEKEKVSLRKANKSVPRKSIKNSRKTGGVKTSRTANSKIQSIIGRTSAQMSSMAAKKPAGSDSGDRVAKRIVKYTVSPGSKKALKIKYAHPKFVKKEGLITTSEVADDDQVGIAPSNKIDVSKKIDQIQIVQHVARHNQVKNPRRRINQSIDDGEPQAQRRREEESTGVFNTAKAWIRNAWKSWGGNK